MIKQMKLNNIIKNITPILAVRSINQDHYQIQFTKEIKLVTILKNKSSCTHIIYFEK